MITKEIKIQIPETLDEKEVKEWMLVKVERHLKHLKENEVASIEDLIKPDVKDFKDKNGIVDIKPPVNEIVK